MGDTVVVVFRNNASFPASMHPHGVFYDKADEGALYNDGTPASQKVDDSVPTGGTVRYVWPIPERAGPGPNDASSLMWPRHSHTNELPDVEAGLIGAIIVTRRGMARPDGSPKDVDREFVTLFASINENASHFAELNRMHYLGDTALAGPRGPRRFLPDETINGLVYGNIPLSSLTMREGERVRWYVFSGSGADLHTPHWHGNTLLVHGGRKDVLDLGGPMLMVTADMVPDSPGIWLLHCHFGQHVQAGMSARYQVLPKGAAMPGAE